jgi:hypothetical protein
MIVNDGHSFRRADKSLVDTSDHSGRLRRLELSFVFGKEERRKWTGFSVIAGNALVMLGDT